MLPRLEQNKEKNQEIQLSQLIFENEPYCVLNYSQPKSQIQRSRATIWDFPETVALIKRCYFFGPQTQD